MNIFESMIVDTSKPIDSKTTSKKKENVANYVAKYQKEGVRGGIDPQIPNFKSANPSFKNFKSPIPTFHQILNPQIPEKSQLKMAKSHFPK